MDTWSSGKNKPNSNPIQSQFKPNQTQNKPNSNPNKPNFKPYLAKMAHHELKYVDRLAQLTLNPFIKGIRKDLNSL
jgi:hypothetical protein